MQIITIVSLVGAVLASAGFALQRQLVMSLAWLFSLAYTVFDKVFPSVFPENVVTSLSLIFGALVLLYCWQQFSGKRDIRGPEADNAASVRSNHERI